MYNLQISYRSDLWLPDSLGVFLKLVIHRGEAGNACCPDQLGARAAPERSVLTIALGLQFAPPFDENGRVVRLVARSFGVSHP